VLRRPLELGQYTSLAFGGRLREVGIAASLGSRGDCFDCDYREGVLLLGWSDPCFDRPRALALTCRPLGTAHLALASQADRDLIGA
jgi:hypothetical protein